MENAKKSRILYVMLYLQETTDELHRASIIDIQQHLFEHGINAERHTIINDLAQLQESGMDIICERGKKNHYYIGERHFELAELKLLVDAIQASKFISTNKSKKMIAKLSALASIYQADDLNRQLYVEKLVKSKNEKILYVVDFLHAAIRKKIQVEFKYYEYDQNKMKVFKHDGQVYYFSPYAMIWNSDNYYVIGYSKSHGKTVKFRVDRIADPKEMQIPIVAKPKKFDLAVYSKSVFQMYDEEIHEVELLCENELMKAIIDRFGEDVPTQVVDNLHFIARVTVSSSNTFCGWVFSFGGRMKIISPFTVLDKFMALARKFCQ